jgi:hypothetical protein
VEASKNLINRAANGIVESGEALIVPAGAVEFMSHDLAGFGAAVAAFRSHLKGDANVAQ